MVPGQPTLVSDPLGSVLNDLVRGSLHAQRVEASHDTECYLTTLLAEFLRSDPDRFSQALGIELLKVRSLPSWERYRKLKELADTSLFVTGVFLDHVEAQLPATDYFLEIGSSAYLQLGSTGERHPLIEPFADTYKDLGLRFEQFVRVLAAMSDADLFASNSRVLGLYERWLQSGSSRDAHRLVALGIIPSQADGSKQH